MTGSWSTTTEPTTLGSIWNEIANFSLMGRAYGLWIDGKGKLWLSVYVESRGWQAAEDTGLTVAPYISVEIFNGRLYCAYRDGSGPPENTNFLISHRATVDVTPRTWMSSLPDSLNDQSISMLTIPGTHDSTADRFFGVNLQVPFIATQNMEIIDQLNAGVRFFDLRLQLRNDVLKMYHGPICLGLSFEEVYKTMFKWLDQNPYEGLVLSIKKENADSSDEYAFAARLDLITTPGAEYGSYWNTGTIVPTLKQIRKKAQVVRRYKIGPDWRVPSIGVDLNSGWKDNNPSITITTRTGVTAHIQDKYDYMNWLHGPDLVKNKMQVVKTAAKEAINNTKSQSIYINFASASAFPVFSPIFIAAGPDKPPLFAGVNQQVQDYVKDKYKKHLGCVLLDVPEVPKDLLLGLIVTNFDQESIRIL